MQKRHRQQSLNITQQNRRLSILVAAIFICSLILIFRLCWMQIFDYKRYQTLSLKNQIGIIPVAPTRGVITDRNGVLMAENVPVYSLEIVPERVHEMDGTLKKLQRLLPAITDDDVERFHKARKQQRSFMSIPLKIKLTTEEVAIFSVHQHEFNGVHVNARLMRYYPFGEMAAHIIGYVGRISEQELQEVDLVNYRATNFIGKSGIEKYYEEILHGQVGYDEVETDVSGRMQKVLNRKKPHSGAKIRLTIDSRLQQAAWDALKDKKGAAVLINAKNGEVLAMVSSPSFDPNLFVEGIKQSDYQALATDRGRPLYHRAVRGLYPPASTVKPFIGLGGLEHGFITPSSTIFDPGHFYLPNSSHMYRDWKKTGHGMIHLKRAITVSCDTFFYQLGSRMGIGVIEDVMTQFGYGHPSNIDLFEEAGGLVPSAEWKKTFRKTPWYPGDTVISSIGQGFMLATPLQMANASAAMGRHGHRYRPHLLLQAEDTDNKSVHHYKILEEYPIKLNHPEYWDVVIDGMQQVIRSPEGTGYRFGKNPPFTMAAKTGTAQVFGGEKYQKMRYQDTPEYLRDHSLFIGFTPVEDTEVAISVIVENDVIASTVARKIIDAWFQLKDEAHS